MTCNIPSCFSSKEFFQKVFNNFCKENNEKLSEVKDFVVKSVGKDGEHIGGSVLRAVITYSEDKKLSVIIKYFTGSREAMGDRKYEAELDIIMCEIKMYSELIPKFEEMLRKCGDVTKLGPRLYYHTEEPIHMVVLEDLTSYGYNDFRGEMLNGETARTAIEKLAKFHACSFKYNYENNDEIRHYTNCLFKLKPNDEMMENGVKNLVKVLKKIPENDLEMNEIIKKLEKIQDKVYNKCSYIHEDSKIRSRFNVLNHGDFHIKNLMFKCGPGNKIKDCQIIDFAMCFGGTAAYDLFYVLYSIYNMEYAMQNRQKIIYEYYKIFEATLKAINCEKSKIPKFCDLMREIYNYGHIELFLVATFLPFSYAFAENNEVNISQFVNEEDLRLRVYHIPAFLKDIKILLKQFVNYGYLDESFY